MGGKVWTPKDLVPWHEGIEWQKHPDYAWMQRTGFNGEVARSERVFISRSHGCIYFPLDENRPPVSYVGRAGGKKYIVARTEDAPWIYIPRGGRSKSDLANVTALVIVEDVMSAINIWRFTAGNVAAVSLLGCRLGTDQSVEIIEYAAKLPMRMDTPVFLWLDPDKQSTKQERLNRSMLMNVWKNPYRVRSEKDPKELSSKEINAHLMDAFKSR